MGTIGKVVLFGVILYVFATAALGFGIGAPELAVLAFIALIGAVLIAVNPRRRRNQTRV